MHYGFPEEADDGSASVDSSLRTEQLALQPPCQATFATWANFLRPRQDIRDGSAGSMAKGVINNPTHSGADTSGARTFCSDRPDKLKRERLVNKRRCIHALILLSCRTASAHRIELSR